jgi:hypothetical protein
MVVAMVAMAVVVGTTDKHPHASTQTAGTRRLFFYNSASRSNSSHEPALRCMFI